MTQRNIIRVLSGLVGGFRPVLIFKEFNPHIEASYEAFAHILIGYILCLYLSNLLLNYRVRRYVPNPPKFPTAYKTPFWILIAIEVICFSIDLYLKRTG